MSAINLTSLGGAGTVTGSRHLVEFEGGRILVDCGLFQGPKALRQKNWEPFPIDPASIDVVVLTHAHLDHCGYLPKLAREGFRGPVLCSSGTAALAEVIMLDSAKIQENDAEFANRRGISRHKPALPLYGKRDAERAIGQLSVAAFETAVAIGRGAELTLRHAGHILGAATAEIRWGGRVVLFSGDLGRYGDPVMLDPVSVTNADYLVVESTYGNRKHDPLDAGAALAEVVEATARRGGTVIIPAFAVGRAQALLFHFWKLKQGGRIPFVPIYLDSPMAINASDILCRHMADHRLTEEECRRSCEVATYVRDVEDSKALTANPMPKVIISASGMATGGRVLHHMKAYGPDRRNTILFSGFQAAGTRGAALVAGAQEVRIHRQSVPIRAEVKNLPMLSAHADADEILRWLGTFEKPPARTFIVHGEPLASEALKMRIEGDLDWACTVPKMGETFLLT